jgi:hypothetical protein
MARPKTDAATYKSLMLRLPAELLDAYRGWATAEHRSLNAQILWVLEACLHDTTESRAQPSRQPKND